MQQNKRKGIILYLLVITIIIVGFAAFSSAFSSMVSEKEDKELYSQFIANFDDFKVNEYTLDLDKSTIKYKLIGDDKEYKYEIPNLTLFLEDIKDYRQNFKNAHGDQQTLTYDELPIKEASWFVQMIPSIVILVLMVVVFFVLMRQAGGGGKINQFAKANVKHAYENKVTFDDVAGCDEEKQELEEVIDFLKNPQKFKDIGARVPKGILLLGPPGTGKTLLAKAVAGEAKVPFFSISGSDFVEMFVGVGASRVRDLFAQAIKNAPSIIFIDEIDAVGRQRGTGLGGGHDEREQTLNQLLVEMDGFTDKQNVIVMAATNRSDVLDPALLRPGRFDRQVTVGYPDVKGREEILKVHAKNKPLAPDVDLNVIAKTTQFFTGAELENLLNEAALLAARKNRKAITEEDIEEATLKVIAGPEKKSRIVTDRDRRITAFHEAGHAVAAYYLPECEKVHQVTTIQRGQAAGLTVVRPETDDSHVTKGKMYQDIVMTMGGRVAEAISFDDVCTGASGDIQQATKRARAMVTQYGFSEKLGPVLYGEGSSEVFLGRDYGHTTQYSEDTLNLIDSEIKRIINTAYDECKAILTEHQDKLNLVAEYLIEHEKIDGDDFEKLMTGKIDETSADALENSTSEPKTTEE